MYNITVIRPTGFLHSSGFTEVVDSLGWALSQLGHQVKITENCLDNMCTNIIFGAELLPIAQQLPNKTIIYNLEQPSHPNIPTVRSLAKNHTVWEYSKAHYEVWKSDGYNVRHVPIGYVPILNRIPKADRQEIDVLFYGFLTPRRRALHRELMGTGLNVVFTDTCYGGARDNLISRAKIVLNIHHDGRENFEIVRASYLLANGKCVVTEPSVDQDEYHHLYMGLIICPYEDIPQRCKSLLSARADEMDLKYYDLQTVSVESIMKYDYVKTVENALL